MKNKRALTFIALLLAPLTGLHAAEERSSQSYEHGSNKAVIHYPGYDDVVMEFESAKVR